MELVKLMEWSSTAQRGLRPITHQFFHSTPAEEIPFKLIFNQFSFLFFFVE
eukprot:UN00039